MKRRADVTFWRLEAPDGCFLFLIAEDVAPLMYLRAKCQGSTVMVWLASTSGRQAMSRRAERIYVTFSRGDSWLGGAPSGMRILRRT